MSTHNICFRREIRKILCGYPLLSVAMFLVVSSEKRGKYSMLELFFLKVYPFLLKYNIKLS